MSPTVMFWVGAGLLLGVVMAILGWPLLRKGKAGAASRRAINAAIYRDELAELEKDRQTSALSEDDYRVAREELERRVLEDTREGDAVADEASSRKGPRTALTLLVLVPVLALPLYFVFGNPAGLTPETQGRHASDGPSAADVSKMVSALEQKLKENPDNPKGWMMLGRSYKAIGRLDDAEKAYARVGSAMETEPALILERVELAALKGEGRIEGKPLALLNKVLKDSPDNPQALLLAGTGAFYRDDYRNAIVHWERLMKQLEPGSEDSQSIASGIEEARNRLAKSGGKAPAADPAAGKGAKASAPDSKPAKAATGQPISGVVEMAPALKDKAAPGDTVFVFARAMEGPRAPLAVVRAKVSDLPLKFNLDDSMAMSPELKLSAFAEVRIQVRVSKSGDAAGKPGDLVGAVGPVKPGAKGVKVVVDNVLQ